MSDRDDGDLDVPLSGSTLIVGPSGAGKTRLTARALSAWIDQHGTDGVVVFEFGPEVERDGRVIGGRLDRFLDVPEGVWHGVLEAHAPRLQGTTDDETQALARDNADRAGTLLEAAPQKPAAVFVNDATIPFQHDVGNPNELTGYCDRAGCAVVNAYDGAELGTDDPVSRRERESLAKLKRWADRTIELE
ncbi:hypothetical protein AArcSl_2691 [Halalkaliarchaeum desulfuricum]|uniref:Uncharacterized protein n=1 Tax=Halalkaliarchaeum desulfuricum TaxID=2055893 RepID=A0A343TMI7_9EURY|nr:hypothetical protein [Halalkaliarchaeum desulfuricum]AUX10309.1 hypothetical protein AArcSl_2691 [Halalkaliarchaeum desulfuricum]